MDVRTLTITRPGQLADMARAYRVSINGEVVGQIKRKEELRLQVPTDAFTLQAHIDWCTSLPLDVPAGTVPLAAEVANKHGLWKAQWAITHAKDDYLRLTIAT